MSHFLMETAVGFSNIMPKPNLKTQVQASKYICVRLISSSFPNWRKEPSETTLTRCLSFTYQTVKLIRDQSTLRSSIYSVEAAIYRICLQIMQGISWQSLVIYMVFCGMTAILR